MIAVRNISDTEFGQGNVFQRQTHAAHSRDRLAWQVNVVGLKQG